MDRLAVSAIGQRPQGILASVFALSGVYATATELAPGRGYWVQLQADGSLSASLPGGNLKPVADTPTDPVRQGVLWLESAGHRQVIDLGVPAPLRQVPPTPPGDILDIRVLVDGLACAQAPATTRADVYPLHVQGRDLVLGWDVSRDADGAWELRTDAGWMAISGRGRISLGDALPSRRLALRQVAARVPTVFGLQRSYPNPFNATTLIEYALPQEAEVSLLVYDVLGQQVRMLVSGNVTAGVHTVRWDGRNNAGRSVGAGVYLVRLVAGEDTAISRMMLVK